MIQKCYATQDGRAQGRKSQEAKERKETPRGRWINEIGAEESRDKGRITMQEYYSVHREDGLLCCCSGGSSQAEFTCLTIRIGIFFSPHVSLPSTAATQEYYSCVAVLSMYGVVLLHRDSPPVSRFFGTDLIHPSTSWRLFSFLRFLAT